MAQYLSLPGDDGHAVDTPDAAALDITGDIDIRVKAAMDDWTPAVVEWLMSKLDGTAVNGYGLRMDGDGAPRFFWGNGSAFSQRASTSAGIANGATKWVRATLDVDNGAAGRDVTFYTSDDGVAWSQLGTTQTTAGTTSITGNAEKLEGGAFRNNTITLAGKLYEVVVLNGIGGTKVAHFNADDFQVGDSDTATAVDVTGKTWTIRGANSEIMADGGPGAGHGMLLFGVG